MWNPKRILAIVLLIATAVVLVVFLYALSDKMNQVPNGFNRKLNTSLTVYQYSIQTDQDVYRIAGVTPYHLYLSTLLPGIVVDINLSARTIARDTLTGAHFPGYHVPFQMTIDSPAITIGIGNFKKIYSGNIPSKKILPYAWPDMGALFF
jgi:FtsP/CotA-like multicopper oxidase with cupredoxin domain